MGLGGGHAFAPVVNVALPDHRQPEMGKRRDVGLADRRPLRNHRVQFQVQKLRVPMGDRRLNPRVAAQKTVQADRHGRADLGLGGVGPHPQRVGVNDVLVVLFEEIRGDMPILVPADARVEPVHGDVALHQVVDQFPGFLKPSRSVRRYLHLRSFVRNPVKLHEVQIAARQNNLQIDHFSFGKI